MRIFFMSLLLLGTIASAQEAAETADAAAKKDEKGKSYSLNVSANANTQKQTNVVGTANGTSTTYGAKIEGNYTDKMEVDEWRNELSLLNSMSQTPKIDKFVKTEDTFKVSSIYTKGFKGVSWLGAYGRLSAKTAILPDYDVREEEVTYVKIDKDGNLEDTIVAKDLKLMDSFNPMTTKESIGMVFKLLSDKMYTTELRVGYGAHQGSLDGQYTISDDETTDTIEVIELESYTLHGAETIIEVRGSLNEDKVTYKLDYELFVPYGASPEKEEVDYGTPWDQRVGEFNGSLSFKLVDWASLDYVLKSSRVPRESDKTQVSSGLMLSFNYLMSGKI